MPARKKHAAWLQALGFAKVRGQLQLIGALRMMQRLLALGTALILGALRSEAQQVSFAPASAASTAGTAVPDSIPATLSLPHSMQIGRLLNGYSEWFSLISRI
jgi:hypothetical protein